MPSQERLGKLRELIKRPEATREQIDAAVERIVHEHTQLKRHADAFRLYWMIPHGELLTYQQIADRSEFKVTRERVRQLVYYVVYMLRRPRWWT